MSKAKKDPPDVERAYARTRKSLIERLKDWDDQKSWEEFYSTYWRLIYHVALKAGLSSDGAFDVVQETVLTVAKQTKNWKFNPEAGSFKNWLMNIARWRIADYFRRRQKHDQAIARPVEDDDDRRTSSLDRLEDLSTSQLERVWNAEWASHLTDSALELVRKRVSPKQYQIFDCYVVREWPARKVAKELGVSLAQVYLAKHRVGALLKMEIRALETKFV